MDTLDVPPTAGFSPFFRGVAAVTAVGLISSCGPHISYKGKQWLKNDKPPAEQVLGATDSDRHIITDLFGPSVQVRYDENKIIFPVQRRVEKEVITATSIKTTYLLEEEVDRSVETGLKVKWERAGCIGGLGLGAGLVALGVPASNNDNDAAAALLSISGIAVAAWGFFAGCDPKDYKHTHDTPTGLTKTNVTTGVVHSAGSRSLVSLLPAQNVAVYLTSNVPIVQDRTYARDGKAEFAVSPQYPVLFTNDPTKVPGMLDVSWLRGACQKDAVDYILQQMMHTDLSVAVVTNERQADPSTTYNAGSLQYKVPVIVGPTIEQIIQYLVDTHINSRIKMATVSYLDVDSHYPIKNVSLTVTPDHVPTPEQLASQCFGNEYLGQALRSVRAYAHEPFGVVINGQADLPVYTPSAFRVKAIHPDYHFRDDVMKFTAEQLVQTQAMRLLGDKHRVRMVPE